MSKILWESVGLLWGLCFKVDMCFLLEIILFFVIYGIVR